MKVKIRKGDTVEVISGGEKDRGKRGQVIKVLPDDHRVVVQAVNIRKKHQRKQQTQGRSMNPGIIEFEAPVDISNVMLVCTKCDKPTRILVQRGDDNVAHRQCKQCGALLD